jgi:hypothetical protein
MLRSSGAGSLIDLAYRGPMAGFPRILIAGSLIGLLAACGGSGVDTAREACDVSGPQAQAGFDPETEPLSRLQQSATAAMARAELAEQAASLNDRWADLSDASRAIASFADLLVQARMEGVRVDAVTTPEMWDQVKYASDAFLAECARARQ